MPALTLARGPGGGFSFEPGKALLEVAQDHVAGHDAASRQISVAIGKASSHPAGATSGVGASSIRR